MQITNEDQILSPTFRAQVIQEIEASSNVLRKYEAYKRYQCYKDKTGAYSMALLARQFDRSTIEEMRYALTNISFVRKVVDKLARVYSNGVERGISENEDATKKLKELEKLLKVNSQLKSTNRFLKLHKNAVLFVKPYPVTEAGVTKYNLVLDVLQPYLYDVLESAYNRCEPIAYVLSDYVHPSTELADVDASHNKVLAPTTAAEAQKSAVAISAPAPIEKQYIFWSKTHHFTTNAKGEITSQGGTAKNIKADNHINYAIDQDGSFWAQGGDDMIDGAILINAMITHTNHVGVTQGYGQFYMTGSKLPQQIKVGVTKSILVQYNKDEDAPPTMGFLSANPQLDALRSLIEMYIALYLTSNNLSTSGVSTSMGSGKDFASGIALILDKAESIEDVQDQRQVFLDNEVKMWTAINETLKAYGTNLVEPLRSLILPDDFAKNFTVKFNDATPIMSEKEKLENMRLRKDLGLETRLSLLMKDDPTLTLEQAEQKLMVILEQEIAEKQQAMEAAKAAGLTLDPATGQPVDPNAPKPNDPNADPAKPPVKE